MRIKREDSFKVPSRWISQTITISKINVGSCHRVPALCLPGQDAESKAPATIYCYPHFAEEAALGRTGGQRPLEDGVPASEEEGAAESKARSSLTLALSLFSHHVCDRRGRPQRGLDSVACLSSELENLPPFRRVVSGKRAPPSTVWVPLATRGLPCAFAPGLSKSLSKRGPFGRGFWPWGSILRDQEMNRQTSDKQVPARALCTGAGLTL